MSTKGRSRRSKRIELNKYQKEEVELAFKTFDTNKNGKIDKHELQAALKAMGFEVSKAEVQDLVTKYDPNSLGITKEFFVEIMASFIVKRNPHEENAKNFGLLDKSKDKRIDVNDLSEAIRNVGLNIDPETIKEMITAFSQDGKEYLTLEEFQEIMTPTQSY